MPTINMARSYREANENGLAGAESAPVELCEHIGQTISPATEEEVTIGAFWSRQLRNIALICDRDVRAQFLSPRYAILQTAIVAGACTVTYTGDLSDIIEAGDVIRVEGTVADDGEYQVETCVEAGGVTTITLTTGHTWPVGGGGAVGTLAKIMSRQLWGVAYPIATAAVGPPGVLTLAGNLTDVFHAGDYFICDNSTNTPPGKDGLWGPIDTVVFAAGVTTITLEAGVAFLDATNDGDITRVTTAIVVPSGDEFLWSRESGLNNPFEVPAAYTVLRDYVAFCMVDNVHATLEAVFEGRIGKDSLP